MEWTGTRGHAINRNGTLFPCGSHDEIDYGMYRNGRTAERCEGQVQRRALACLGTWGMRSRVCHFQQRQKSIQCENAPRVQTFSGLHRSMSYLRSDAKARWKSSREGQGAHAHDMQTKSGGTRSGAARPDALRRAGRDCVWVRRKPSRTARGQHVHDMPLFAWPTLSPLSHVLA